MGKRSFFPRLALVNLVRNSRYYSPYLLSCGALAAMYYILRFLTWNEVIQTVRGAAYLQSMMFIGCFVVALFSAVLLLYANSFVMKRRQKELGLYNILGLEKRHIAALCVWETLLCAAAVIPGGIAAGILLSKLILLLLLKLVQIPVQFGFSVSIKGMGETAALLGVLFLLATVLIIYYKQISEGYEDQRRYQIIQQVGMSRREVGASIRGQILLVFFLPLLAAGLHILAAFPMLCRILELFGLYDVGLFALCTAGTLAVFAAVYALVYGLTARTYEGIIGGTVSEATEHVLQAEVHTHQRQKCFNISEHLLNVRRCSDMYKSLEKWTRDAMKASESKLLLAVEFQINPFGREITGASPGPGSPGYGPGSRTGYRYSRRSAGPRSSCPDRCCRTWGTSR